MDSNIINFEGGTVSDKDLNVRLAIVEDRVIRMEDEMKAIYELKGLIIAVQAAQAAQTGVMSSQAEDLKRLNDISSRGKGALAMFLTMGAVIGAAGGWLLGLLPKMH